MQEWPYGILELWQGYTSINGKVFAVVIWLYSRVIKAMP